MNNKLFKIAFTIFFTLLLGAIKADAQESCTEKLYKANLLFEKGQFKEAINIALTCTSAANNITDRWQAYYLLTIAYMADNQKSEARKTGEKMMELNPTYKPRVQDPIELKRLLKSIKVIPKITLGLAATIGGNISFPVIYGTYNAATYQKTYTAKSSWQMGALFGYQMNEILGIHLALISSNKKFNINYSIEGKDIEVNENLTYFDLPLYARFMTLPIKGMRFFGDIGAYTGRLSGAQSIFTIKDSVNSNTSNKINSEDRRKKWEHGILGGAGVVFKVKQVNLAIDVRYYLASFTRPNVTNADARYDFKNLIYKYYFLDDDYKLNNLAISFSILYPLNYKVLKK